MRHRKKPQLNAVEILGYMIVSFNSETTLLKKKNAAQSHYFF